MRQAVAPPSEEDLLSVFEFDYLAVRFSHRNCNKIIHPYLAHSNQCRHVDVPLPDRVIDPVFFSFLEANAVIEFAIFQDNRRRFFLSRRMILPRWWLSLHQLLEEKWVVLLEALESHPAIDDFRGAADDGGLEGLLLDCLIDIACYISLLIACRESPLDALRRPLIFEKLGIHL